MVASHRQESRQDMLATSYEWRLDAVLARIKALHSRTLALHKLLRTAAMTVLMNSALLQSHEEVDLYLKKFRPPSDHWNCYETQCPPDTWSCYAMILDYRLLIHPDVASPIPAEAAKRFLHRFQKALVVANRYYFEGEIKLDLVKEEELRRWENDKIAKWNLLGRWWRNREMMALMEDTASKLSFWEGAENEDEKEVERMLIFARELMDEAKRMVQARSKDLVGRSSGSAVKKRTWLGQT